MDEINGNVFPVIAKILDCHESEIQNMAVMKKGMTNRSYSFLYKDKHFLARIPGEGTSRLIDRKKEYAVYQKVAPLGICDDIVHIDPENGCKITVFWKDVRVCNPHNPNDVLKCMKKLKDFHSKKLVVPHAFDLFERIEFYEKLWNQRSRYHDYNETKANMMVIKEYIDSLNIHYSLTHIDAVPDNFLIFPNEEIRLIDWEYSAMQDPHVDIAMFAVYAMYERPQVETLIDSYFPEGCPLGVRTKIYAYIAVCGLVWSNWCEYKSQYDVEFGDYALKQYQFAKDYFKIFEEATHERTP